MDTMNLALLVYSLTNSPVGVPAGSIETAVRPHQQKLRVPEYIPPIAIPIDFAGEREWRERLEADRKRDREETMAKEEKEMADLDRQFQQLLKRLKKQQ